MEPNGKVIAAAAILGEYTMNGSSRLFSNDDILAAAKTVRDAVRDSGPHSPLGEDDYSLLQAAREERDEMRDACARLDILLRERKESLARVETALDLDNGERERLYRGCEGETVVGGVGYVLKFARAKIRAALAGEKMP